MIKILTLAFVLLATACVKHEPSPSFEPISTFTGRLLVLDSKHRFQVELDWAGDDKQGNLRMTHALSGRIVFVQWKNQAMFWRDNDKAVVWNRLSMQELKDMGVMLPPWMLARIFLGKYPETMRSKDGRIWKGTWYEAQLQIKWSNAYKRLEITDFKQGKRVVVVLNE